MKRYKLVTNFHDAGSCMVEDDFGDYVKHEDTFELQKENEELKEIIDSLIDFFDVHGGEVHYNYIEGTNIGAFNKPLEKKLVSLIEDRCAVRPVCGKSETN